MVLNESDYKEMVAMACIDGGNYWIEYEKDGERLEFSYHADCDYTCYQHDYDCPPEYTLVDISVEVSDINSYNEEGDETDNNFDSIHFKDLVEEEALAS